MKLKTHQDSAKMSREAPTTTNKANESVKPGHDLHQPQLGLKLKDGNRIIPDGSGSNGPPSSSEQMTQHP